MRYPTAVLLVLSCFLAVSGLPGRESQAQEAADSVRKVPAPFPEFEAKRIRPPKPGAQKRITIQIEPEPEITSAVLAPEGHVVPDAPEGSFSGFWGSVSDKLSDAGPGRLGQALAALGGETSVAAPRLQVLQDIASERGIDILTASVGTDVSPALVLAVIAVESAGKTGAVSRVGAEGLMQLMPDTARRFGVEDAFDSAQNIRGGVSYLNWLMAEFDRDPILVLAGYNAGEGAVRSHAGVPPFAETRDYVPKVLAAFQVARGLCMTPPELITDGCVFRQMN
ncbi:lytic transglycosylase domain-containing protein [Phaeobacter italicus]|uniref:lytic transglycosylase domain-containing protein n=1 Tax=Phaeobacter italicus TaxID=481446 RepID=UPI00295EF21A|nr:lytic transglycosylase domain-containing protein [Phaeobacter italicus]